VYGGVAVQGGLAVRDGKICAVGTIDALPDAPDSIDATGLLVLPGVIDPHVHFREPGLEDREDFGTGSLAAAFGGVTAVFDMPNTVPPTSDGNSVRQKREIAKRKSVVDFGLFGIVGQENIEQIEDMAKAGVIGFKFYLHQSMEGIEPCDDGSLLEAFHRVAATGLRAAVHAENPSIIARQVEALKAAGRTDVLAFHEARPPVSESAMVERCLLFARHSGARLHVCHVTSAETVGLLRAAKDAGIDVTAETGPQWLWFTREDVGQRGGILVFSPPFRLESDRQALWDGLRDGTIDMIATDHAPRHRDEKVTDSVWDAKSGFVGVETAVPLLLTAVNEGRLTIERYVRLTSENPARAYGLWPRKGSLAVGADADITIANPEAPGVIVGENLHSRARATPFEGVRVSASIVHTIVRGKVVLRGGQFTGEQYGRDVQGRDD